MWLCNKGRVTIPRSLESQLSIVSIIWMEEGGAKEPGNVRNLGDYGGWVKWSVPSLSYPDPTQRHPMLYQRRSGGCSESDSSYPSIGNKKCIFGGGG